MCQGRKRCLKLKNLKSDKAQSVNIEQKEESIYEIGEIDEGTGESGL